PAPFACSPRKRQEERRRSERQEGGAREVDGGKAPGTALCGGIRGGEGDRGHAEGHAQKEAPAPSDVVRQQATERGTGDVRDRERAGEEADVLAAFGGRKEIPHDGEHTGEDHAATEALNAPGDDELRHRLGEAAA